MRRYINTHLLEKNVHTGFTRKKYYTETENKLSALLSLPGKSVFYMAVGSESCSTWYLVCLD